MSQDRLYKFSDHPVEPDTSLPAGWTVAKGSPTPRAFRHYKSEDGKVISGIWEATPGVFEVSYAAWEFCQILSGRCVITPEGGEPIEKDGDTFVVLPGFRGHWEVVTPVRKSFVFRL